MDIGNSDVDIEINSDVIPAPCHKPHSRGTTYAIDVEVPLRKHHLTWSLILGKE